MLKVFKSSVVEKGQQDKSTKKESNNKPGQKNDNVKRRSEQGKKCYNCGGSVSRSTKFTPFRLMFGVDMHNPEDARMIEVLQKELTNDFIENRSEERTIAAANIATVQLENKKQFDKKRKSPTLYTVGDLVAIEKVQKEKGEKFHTAMVGPYEVVKIKRNNRYEVQKVGFGDGPISTSSPADRMKRWVENATDE